MLELLTVLALAAPQAQTLALTAEQEDVFALLDRFDPLDTSRLPFVRVATGRLHRDSGGSTAHRYGFLLESDGKRFAVRYLELGKEHFECTPGTEGYHRIAFEPVDLRDEVARAITREGARSWYRDPDTPMAPEPRAMLLARACAERFQR